jgi:chondroitin 4-sulfotransferase 11
VLVSDSHKLVFVHIQKTGGVTVDDLLWKRIPDLRSISARHAFARRGRAELDAWDEYFKFAFARNPWDRLVSWYTMITTFDKGGNELWWYVHDNSSTFEDFIHNCTGEVEIKKGVYYSFAYNQLDYVTDEHGNLLVDFIGRLENLDQDIHEVFRRLGLVLEKVPHHNRSLHRHYSTFYTPETEMIVRERFKRDIEYFGYEFERPHALQDAESMETDTVGSRPRSRRRVAVEPDGEPEEEGTEVCAGRGPKDKIPGRPGLLFICGCDRVGTTALADFLNRHPEILVRRESSRSKLQREITPDLDDRDRLVEAHAGSSAKRDPARLRWIGASNSDYVTRMEAVAGINPGARFMVVYRPVEEVTALGEKKDADDENSYRRLRQAVETWNRSLQGTRRFIRGSLVPRVLLIGYHDLIYRAETVVPLISRFLELEFDESVTEDWADEVLQSESGRIEERLSSEMRSLVEKQANRTAEAWILDHIDKQWEKPGLYTQESSKAALATYLDEMEGRTWRLQQKVKELERDRKRGRRRLKRLKSSRTWKLVHKISGIRAKMVGR